MSLRACIQLRYLATATSITVSAFDFSEELAESKKVSSKGDD